MPEDRNRPGDKRRADAVAARAKGAVTRSVGTSRGNTTFGSKSNNQGGMSAAGYQSEAPSMGLSRSAISNSSFIPKASIKGKPKPKSQAMFGHSYDTIFYPHDFNVNDPGVATEAAKVRLENSKPSAARPTRPKTRSKNTTETTSPRANVHFGAAKTEFRKRKLYKSGVESLGGPPNASERREMGQFSKAAKESISLGRGEARDYMNDYTSDQTAKMRKQLATRKAAATPASTSKAAPKRKTMGMLLGIGAAGSAMGAKKR